MSTPPRTRRFAGIPGPEAQTKWLPGSLPKSAQSKPGDSKAALSFFFGNNYAGKAGAEGAESEVLPPMEFDHVTPVALLFFEDKTLPVEHVIGPTESWVDTDYVYNTDIAGGDPGAATLKFNDFLPEGGGGPINPVNAPTAAYLSRTDAIDSGLDPRTFTSSHPTGLVLKVTWGTSHLYFNVSLVTESDEWLELAIVLTDGVIANGDDLVDSAPVTIRFEAPGDNLVNAGSRARIVYRAGKSGDISFDCDWAGGLVLFAERLTVSRLNYKPDPRADYVDGDIRIAVTAAPQGPHAVQAATDTHAPMGVALGESRIIPIHNLARSVSLLLTYGTDDAPSGDAPLGQLFIAFVSKIGHALAWIDAASCSNRLFGEGIAIPAGATSLALTNSSADPSVRLGAVFHLAP